MYNADIRLCKMNWCENGETFRVNMNALHRPDKPV